MKCQTLFSFEEDKNIKLPFAAVVISTLRVNLGTIGSKRKRDIYALIVRISHKAPFLTTWANYVCLIDLRVSSILYGRTLRKCVLGHRPTAKALVRLRIRAV